MIGRSRRLGGGPQSAPVPWDGAPRRLLPGQGALLSETPDGSTILSLWNRATQNNAGQLTIASGGGTPQIVGAPALDIAPTILVHNWAAASLTVTNTSRNAATPIDIEAYGPGMPGRTIKPLPSDGQPVQVALGDALQGQGVGAAMRLDLRASSGRLALFAVIGGPADANGNNAFVYAVNFWQAQAPPGYTAVVTGNTYSFDLRWTTEIFVAYFGAGSVATLQADVVPPPTVTLTQL